MNDSSTGGFLAPSSQPTYDATLEDLFQSFAVGVTGLAGQMVRPKWQQNPGNVPDPTQDWIALGLALQARQWDAVITHTDDANGGTSTVSGSEEWACTFSIYGPNCQLNESILRDGMSLGQNRDIFESQQIKFIEFKDPVTLPALLKDKWSRRIDLTGIFHRWGTRIYAVRTIASASGTIYNEQYSTPFSATK